MLYQFNQIAYAANVIYSEHLHLFCASGAWVAEVSQAGAHPQ